MKGLASPACHAGVFGLLLLVGSAEAQRSPITQQEIDVPADISLPCREAPTEAVTKVPDRLSPWLQVRCTVFGHFVLPAEGWLWKQPGSSVFFRINAQGDKPSFERLGHAAYFRKIEIADLNRAQSEKAIGAFSKGRSLPADPGKVLMVRMTNQIGEISELFLFTPKPDFFWLGFSMPGKTLTAYAASLEFINRK